MTADDAATAACDDGVVSEELDGIDDRPVSEGGDPACWADEFTEYLGLDGAEPEGADDHGGAAGVTGPPS